MTFLKQFVKQIFRYEARLILKKNKPKIIAITGSVGKTSTRDAIYLVLSKKFFVRKSEKSFTTELGIPLTIIGCQYGTGSVTQWIKNMLVGLRLLFSRSPYPDWLVLEIDGDKPGDFQGLSEWFHPDILVVTTIGDVPAHVETFGSIEELLFEKQVLLNTMKRDGVIIYNCDDTHTSQLADTSGFRKISCGIGGDGDVRGGEFLILYGNASGRQIPTGMSIPVDTYKITVFNTIGIHNEYACLIAYAVGHELGITPQSIVSSLSQYITLPGRMNILSGIKDSVIIDDSYNSSPIALHESLYTFNALETTSRKIVVLGDMLELGKYSVEEHKKIAHELLQMSPQISYIILVGIRSRGTAEELLSLGYPDVQILSVDTSEQAGNELQRILEPGDAVLIKGSQAMRMERVAFEILRHPQDAPKLLVRQEPEWLERV